MEDECRAAGISAEDLLAAVRVHLDRVHDAVRRLGCAPDEAVDVVQTSAIDLVEVVATAPETVEDAVGWWFARARDLGRRAAAGNPDLPLGKGMLAVDEDQQILAEALEQLPERERVALLLRDSYDLPDVSVAAALRTDPAAAMRLVALARLDLIPLVDDEPAPQPADHQSDLGALARLGEGGPVAARDATVRRHALSCASCQAVTDAQQRAHLLLTGLTVVALPEADRVVVLAMVEDAARELLPSTATLLLRGREELQQDEDEDPRLFSPLLAVLALVVAAVVGLGAGLLLSRGNDTIALAGADGQLPPGVRLASPSPAAPRSTAPPPTFTAPTPQTSVFLVPPPQPTPSPTPSPQPSPTQAPNADSLAITLDPNAGPNGTPVTVTGVGWPPGAQVAIEYLDSVGEQTGSGTSAIADAAGRFSTQLTVQDPNNLPGRHTVRATDGLATAETSFDAQA